MEYKRYKVDLRALYRYSSAKWNKALLDTGSIRVGTLHDYRDAEHKPGILDAEEGLKWVHHPIKHWNGANENPGFQSMDARAIDMMGIFRGEDGGPPKDFQISNINMVRVIEEPNCFIHCTSYKLSKDVMSKFAGADSCLEIYDLSGFYRALTNAINEQVPVGDIELNVVNYKDRNERFNGVDFGLDACWMKGVEFSGQYEVRARWYPRTNDPIKPLFLEAPELSKFVQRVKVR